MKNTFASKVLMSDMPVICFELTPPNSEADIKDIKAYANCVDELMSHKAVHVDALNLPEIHEENGVKRLHPGLVKMDNRKFADLLRANMKHSIEFIINHCTVYDDLKSQAQWLKEAQEKELYNIILVGGESSEVKYPGPSVTEFASFLKKQDGSLFLGGINIPTRRYPDLPKLDEPNRLVQKSKAGVDFFTTQVIYEAESVKSLLNDYQQQCLIEDVSPRRIFLSFAPISTVKDLEFLKWLGVIIPDETQKKLIESTLGIGWRSMKTCKDILQDILSFVEKNNIRIPLGLNIEYISMHNFEQSWEFMAELGSMYIQYMKHQSKHGKRGMQ